MPRILLQINAKNITYAIFFLKTLPFDLVWPTRDIDGHFSP